MVPFLMCLAKVGETAVPSPDSAVVVFGDLSSLQLRAEVEERDAAKVHVGQRVVVKADAFPDKTFEGSVTSISQSLGAPRIATRGPRRAERRRSRRSDGCSRRTSAAVHWHAGRYILSSLAIRRRPLLPALRRQTRPRSFFVGHVEIPKGARIIQAPFLFALLNETPARERAVMRRHSRRSHRCVPRASDQS